MADEQTKRATVGEAHVTNMTSELIFLQSLPERWLVRKQTPDIHIDYKVEITEAGELTGINVGVQLKGWTPKKGRKKGPCYPLSTKQLRYYVEKCTIPIFLVLVDVTTRQCYWVFIQQYEKEKLAAKMSPKQKSITVHFAAEDALRKEALLEIVTKANAYVRELHPGSVQAAASHHKAQFEAKYPQCSFDLNYVGGKVHLDVQPKGKMPLKIRVPTDAHLAAIQECFERGKDVEFSNSEIQFTGPSFFDEHVNGKPGVVRLLKKAVGQGEAQISWTDEQQRPRFLTIPGEFKSGSKFITFQGALAGSPLSIETWFSPQALDKGQVPNCHFGFSAHEWHGKKVIGLPHFEQIRQLFARKKTGLPLRFELFFEGNSLGYTSFQEQAPERIKPMTTLLELLEQARVVARHFEINPHVPNWFSEVDLICVQELHDLIVNKRHDYNVTGQTFTLVTVKPAAPADLDAHTLTMTAELDKVYSVFDARFCVGPLRETTSDIKYVSRLINEKGETEFHYTHSNPSPVTVVPIAEKLTKQLMPDVEGQ